MNNIFELQTIKLKLQSKEIDYNTAKILSKPYIDNMNIKGAEIAKKYNQKPKKITFSSFMR